MHGVIVRDGTQPGGGGGLEFDLAQVLAALGDRVAASSWRARELSYVSQNDAEIEPLERLRAGALVSGADLLDSLPRLIQVIDGEFEGFELDGEPPWVVVRAVDSSWWEVHAERPEVLAAVRAWFHSVEDLPHTT